MISFVLNKNLDCNIICKEIQNLIQKNNLDGNQALVIKIEQIKDSQTKTILGLPAPS